MLKLSASLGLKYFRSSKGAFVSFTSIMAVIGLTIGVAALIIVTSVMNGFEKELKDRILGVIPHVLIHSKEPISDYQVLIDQIERNPDVDAASPFIQNQALISIGNRSKGILLTGIDVKKESNVSILPENMLMGSIETLNDNGIILGYWLAAHLGTSIGDEVNITTSEMRSSIIGSFPRSFKVSVSGILNGSRRSFRGGTFRIENAPDGLGSVMVNNKFYGTGENISKQNIRYGAVTGKKPENFNYDYEIIVTSFDVKIGNSTNVSVNGNSIDNNANASQGIANASSGTVVIISKIKASTKDGNLVTPGSKVAPFFLTIN